MIRRTLTLVALLAFVVALPRAQSELGTPTAAEELAADVESATRYAVASSTGYSLIYDDADVVSLACADAVDPSSASSGSIRIDQPTRRSGGESPATPCGRRCRSCG